MFGYILITFQPFSVCTIISKWVHLSTNNISSFRLVCNRKYYFYQKRHVLSLCCASPGRIRRFFVDGLEAAVFLSHYLPSVDSPDRCNCFVIHCSDFALLLPDFSLSRAFSMWRRRFLPYDFPFFGSKGRIQRIRRPEPAYSWVSGMITA